MRWRSVLVVAAVASALLTTALASADTVTDPARAGAQTAPGVWRYEGVRVGEVHAHINHYVWESDRPPFGPYDKIALHRWVGEPDNPRGRPGHEAPDPRKVLFVIPGTWSAAEAKDPADDTNQWFAAQGYDVYSLDFRTSYVPNLPYDRFDDEGQLEGLQSTANWTYEAFREDIKAAVELSKDLSGADKVFLAGRSRGGTQMYIYAAKYADDLKGMIGLDGGPIYRRAENPAAQRTEEEFRAALESFAAGALAAPYDTLLAELPLYENAQLAGVLPYATAQVGAPLPDEAELPHGPPPDGSTIETISDLLVYQAYWEWGEGLLTNYYTPYPGGSGEGYITKKAVVDRLSNYLRWWPRVQDLEASFMAGYANVPFLDYDDTEHVTVPIIHFSGELTCRGGSCLSSDQPRSTASADFTIKYLPGYGHLDVYAGTHAEEDVDRPMLEWMNARL